MIDAHHARVAAQLDASGFTPGGRDLHCLVDLLGEADRSKAKRVEKAFARVESTVIASRSKLLIQRLNDAQAPLRGRLARVLGRLAVDNPTFAADLRDPLLAALAGDDPQAERHAFAALGKLGPLTPVDKLVAHAQNEQRLPHLRTFVETLGKCGNQAALEWIEALSTSIEAGQGPDDANLQRIVGRARLMLRRTIARPAESDRQPTLTAVLARPTRVVLNCRVGLQFQVAEVCRELCRETRVLHTDPGRVVVEHRGPLANLFQIRSALDFGISCRLGPGPLEKELVHTIKSAKPWLTAGLDLPVRLRLHFARGGDAGRQRSKIWQLAQALDHLDWLLNDPTRSHWEAHIHGQAQRKSVTFVPRGFTDPRFAYRCADVPAASHPTVAAALAHYAVNAHSEGAVWDPFVGSGLELVECGLRNPEVELIGTDLDAKALDAASQNLESAGLASRADLRHTDALRATPAGVTTIITNPPMGRRVQRGDVGPLLDQLMAHAQRVLPRGGKLWWVSPLPQRTRARARSLRWRLCASEIIDMGGFDAELQGFVR
ncbi:MAG: methyltransferase [Nannocystaceae bacterium]